MVSFLGYGMAQNQRRGMWVCPNIRGTIHNSSDCWNSMGLGVVDWFLAHENRNRTLATLEPAVGLSWVNGIWGSQFETSRGARMMGREMCKIIATMCVWLV